LRKGLGLTGTWVLTLVRLDLTRRIGIQRLHRARAARAAALAPAAMAHGGGRRRIRRTWPKTAVWAQFQAPATQGERGRYRECI
jgi:hypothetical protein